MNLSKKQLKNLYLLFILIIALGVGISAILDNNNNNNNNKKEGFIGKHIRPHIRRARIIAENKMGDYGRYITTFLRRNNLL